jgi:hypothetical protein
VTASAFDWPFLDSHGLITFSDTTGKQQKKLKEAADAEAKEQAIRDQRVSSAKRASRGGDVGGQRVARRERNG